MLIEYKIKLEPNGLTIMQHVESSGFQNPPVKNHAGVRQKQLGPSFVASKTENAVTPSSPATPRTGGGDGIGSPRGLGGGDGIDGPRGLGGGLSDFGSGSVMVIGPIILTCPPHSAASGEPEVNHGK